MATADRPSDNDNAPKAGFFAAAGKLLASFRETVNPMIETVSEPLLRDGLLGSAFRMGLDELGQGLKAFPDSIQAVEPGGLFNPLPSEIAAARDHPGPAMSLEDVLKSNTIPPPGQSNDKDQGYGL